MSSPQAVELFFRISCPWSYLAFVRLNEAALRTGASVVYRPVLEDGLQTTALQTADGTARANYAAKDLRDWARFAGVTVKLPNTKPKAVFAQRAIVAAIDAGRGKAFIDALFAALFKTGDDIDDSAVVLAIATDCGLSATDFEKRADSPTTTDAVATNTRELLARGGFTVPTMFVSSDMYVGNDRVPLVESALMRAADRPFIAPGEHDRL